MAKDKLKKRIADQIRRSTPEYKARRSEQRKAALRAKAAAEGREVRVWRYSSDEERKIAEKAKYNRWKQSHLEAARKSDAERHKAARSTPEGLAKFKASSAKYREANREKLKAANKKWNEENFARYYAENREHLIAHTRNYRAKKRGNGGTHTAADIRELFFEQKGRCAWCDGAMEQGKYDVDHWKPISKGGSNDKSNLKLLHSACNKSKGAKLPPELIKGVS
jgi:5-methylcytosine-specific restriction endonuclease McrA